MTVGLAHSVQTRLVQYAKLAGIDPNVVFARFACERFLYRLACSVHADLWVEFVKERLQGKVTP